MERSERLQKIEQILQEVNRKTSGKGIPIDAWINALSEDPNDPGFQKWLVCCTEAVDDYEIMTGKKDRDSIFAEYVCKYGRRKEGKQ